MPIRIPPEHFWSDLCPRREMVLDIHSNLLFIAYSQLLKNSICIPFSLFFYKIIFPRVWSHRPDICISDTCKSKIQYHPEIRKVDASWAFLLLYVYGTELRESNLINKNRNRNRSKNICGEIKLRGLMTIWRNQSGAMCMDGSESRKQETGRRMFLTTTLTANRILPHYIDNR